MNVLVDQLAFVDVTIAEPYVDRIEPGDVAENLESHLFADLAHGRLAVTLAIAHMALGECPLAVGIDDHSKVYRTSLALKHQSSSGYFGAMSFTLAASFA